MAGGDNIIIWISLGTNLVLIVGAFWKLKSDVRSLKEGTVTKDEFSEFKLDTEREKESFRTSVREEATDRFEELKGLIVDLEKNVIRIMTHLKITSQE